VTDSKKCQIVISGFADEVCRSKDLDQQFAVIAALGMEYFSIRFVSINGQIKNSVDLSDQELLLVKSRMSDYGLQVSSLGSPLGKIKLLDVEDGTSNRFVPFPAYLDNEVRRACEVAVSLDTKLIRGFSFYHPKGTEASEHFNQAADQIAALVDVVAQHDLVFGLEVEANLVGHTGELLAEIFEYVDHPNLRLIFDGANLVTQGFSSEQVFQQYLAMKAGLGWLHIKDYQRDKIAKTGAYVDEDSLQRFVPIENGDAAYRRIFEDLCNDGQSVFDRSDELGLPGLYVDLEPHLKGGGQFGGYSDADGFGLAFRSLCRVLTQSGLSFHLRDLAKIKSSM